MKVLLFSNDLMPFGNLPTSGGGLRCWQLMKGLEAHGVQVSASMPGFTFLAEKHYQEIPEEQRELLWRWETQDDILARVRPDAVLFASNWDHFNLSKALDVPLIIDLHGSRLIETTMWNNPVSTEKKVSILSRADCLLSAGIRQRSYFYGWLVQAGRVPKDEHFIRYVPISMSPDLPIRKSTDLNERLAPYFVSGGGWFPWQNQSKTIFSICQAVNDYQRGSIQIFGTPHETANVSAEEKIIREVYARVLELSKSSERICVNGYVGRDDLIEIYRGAHVAVEAMQYNLERELAFTTRTIEYLWCGLPVIYNNYSEISSHIKEYDAGWTIDPNSEQEISEVIREILSSPEIVQNKSDNARRLVKERFSWDKTILPFLEFLNHPSRASAVTPAYGAVSTCPSFLSPRGNTADIGITAYRSELRQKFITPAENISYIQVPISLRDEHIRDSISKLTLQVLTLKGRVLAEHKYLGTEIPSNGKLAVVFPKFRRPRGGVELELVVRLEPLKNKGEISASMLNEPYLFIKGLIAPVFPFVADKDAIFWATNALGEAVQAQVLLFNFVPGGGRLYRVKILAERALEMIKQGQWLQLTRAAMRLSPRVVGKLRQKVFSG